MPPPEVHDEGHDSQGGIDPLAAAQLEALTEAINQLSAKLGPSAVGGAPGSLAPPWWFKGGTNKPAAGAGAGGDYPESVYQVAAATGESPADIAAGLGIRRDRRPRATGGGAGPAAGGGSGGPPKPPWTYLYTNPQPDPGPYGGDPGRMPAGAPWWAKYLTSAGQPIPPPPGPVSGMAAAMGQASGTVVGGNQWIAAAMGMAGGGGAYAGPPPGPTNPMAARMASASGTILGGSQWITAAMGMGGSGQPYSGVPWATRAQTPWNRKRGGHPWHWSTTRKFAAFARLRGGKRAGRMAMAGMSAAAQRFAFSGSISSAARVGVMGAATAGGAATFGVVAMGVAAVKAAEALNKLTAEQLTYNRHLATASASMAFVFAQRDLQERMRNREVGDRLAASAGRLTAAEQFKEDNTKEIGIAWNRLKNDVGAAWEVFKGGLFFQLNAELGVLNRIQEIFEGNFFGDKYLKMDEYVRGLAQEDATARKNKDPKWQPPKFK